MPPYCARSASDPRTQPFFPLSATKALQTTALVLVSQGFGCPTVVQGLGKHVQCRGRERSNSAIIVCSRQACSGSKTLHFSSPCNGDVHAVRSGRCPMHALDFHHLGKPREGKVRFVRVLQSPPLPLPLKSRVCRCLQSVPSPWKYHHLWPRVEPILLIQHWHRWAEKRQSERFQGKGREDDEQANESDSFPNPVEPAMRKHERRAPRQSQLKLKNERKRFSCPNGVNRRASGAKTATTHCTTANGANRRASVAGAKSATPTACVTSAEMAVGLRQTSHSSGEALPPPFLFLWLLVQFFFNVPLLSLTLKKWPLSTLWGSNFVQIQFNTLFSSLSQLWTSSRPSKVKIFTPWKANRNSNPITLTLTLTFEKVHYFHKLWPKMSGVFCTNNAQAPSLFSNVTLTSRRSYVVHCLYKKLQTCLPNSRRPAKPYLWPKML